jgi:NifU-like protein involved in Fe-S cluster formation
MKLQIRVDESGIISDVKFKTFGCGSAIASSSYMTERVKGLSLEDAEKIKNTDIAKELCLPPVKLHCSSTFTHGGLHACLVSCVSSSARRGRHPLCHPRLPYQEDKGQQPEASRVH